MELENLHATREPIKVLQITDTHLYAVPEGTLLKMRTNDSFRKVINLLQKDEQGIDLVLATGDISQDGSEKAYQHFIDSVQILNAPVRWVPGNHDLRDVMAVVGEESGLNNKVEKLGNWQIVLLDSSRTNHVDGFIGEQEMQFLDQALREAEADPDIEHCLVTLHHNPIPGSSSWMRDIGLRNDREFIKLLKHYDIVRAIVYGHIHQELDFKVGNIRCFCTPSTCIQFKPEVIDFALDKLNPGYRRLELFADGTIETEVIRIDGNGLMADFDSAGY